MRHLLVGIVATLCVASTFAAEKTPPEGVLPRGKDGKALNFDFETGTLKDWTSEGDAFRGQPIEGDTVAPRRGDMKSGHQGRFWIGSYERAGDKPRGTLTSVPFEVTHPWATFLVGGGPWPETCVELVRADTGNVFSRTSGIEEENLKRVAIDLRPHLGKSIFIRLVDQHTGHWGHINFDDFRFHSEEPNLPPRKEAPPAADVYAHAGLTPAKAAAAMTVPEKFSVSLFAGEPDIRQPIAFCLDDRGRLWVAEAYSYPIRRPDNEAIDRILIFEDTDGDGKFDKRTIFMEGLNLVSGLEVGFGGVWIGAAPYLLYVPIKPGTDSPAGPAQILLDGWHHEDTHETLNAFRWGPDGWLYGCHGVFTHSRVGKPGTPDADRTPINAGVWRYHPTRHTFEVFAHGTSNPWGLDFDEHGQAFVSACVIPHAYHLVQGGRYLRQAGSHFNPHTYADIDTIADHLHWRGTNQWAANGSSSSVGGGHAHCGLMLYQGGAWPDEYRGRMFMGNIHGHRFNTDILRRRGSGFVASHGPDFLQANDSWARFINLRAGPDGNVFFLDWYDKQACHHHDPNIWDRENGRIYKVSYRGTQPVTVDLAKKTDTELIGLLGNKNTWYARHATRLLQERWQRHIVDTAIVQHELSRIAFGNDNAVVRLRALWALHAVCDSWSENWIDRGLRDADEYIRAWTIQLAAEKSPIAVDRLTDLSTHDPSPVVRLYLAALAQRLPLAERWQLLKGLLAHRDDGDPNLPLMYWYAAEPLATADVGKALKLANDAQVGLLLPFMCRRVAEMGTPEALAQVVQILNADQPPSRQLAVLRALSEGLRGRRMVAAPAGWAEVAARLKTIADADLRRQVNALSVTFGDAAALAKLRETLTSSQAELEARSSALEALLAVHDDQLAPALHGLLREKALRAPALRGLAQYDHAETPAKVLAIFTTLGTDEKRDALNTMAARPAYGKALLDAVASKQIPAEAISADLVRQLRNLHDKDLDARIAEVWGVVRATQADRARLISTQRARLQQPGPTPDLSLGRAVFIKTCQQCHTLYGVGGKVGPDITGSNRADLNYLLENILDPSAVIPNDYKVTLLELKSGRVVTGIVKGETPSALTVVTANEVLTISPADVDTRKASDLSMMPDDLLKPLTELEIRSLIAYLRHPQQVPYLATAENVKDFFNGKDLAGWDGDRKLWSVENGEIVGKSPGLARNQFLTSQLTVGDFRFSCKVKLKPNRENSGVQFHSEALPDGEMKGPQADIGAGWWGKLYEENGRGLLWDKPADKLVHVDEWNDYEVVAQGGRVRTFLNGKLCVDLDDPAIARRGIFGLQIHSGGPMEVRFKDLKLELLSEQAK